MQEWKRVLYDLNPYLLSSIGGALFIAQIVLTLVFWDLAPSQALRYVGMAVWTAGAAFAIIPIFVFRSRGNVPKGKSYMHTTTLVDSGIYAIVRHPQAGAAGILLSLALMLIAQHWLVVVLGVVAMGLTYLDTLKADQYCIEKFGDDYVRYMERVPRLNFVLGAVRLARRRKQRDAVTSGGGDTR